MENDRSIISVQYGRWLQYSIVSYYVFGPPSEGPAQVSQDLGSHRGKVQKEIGHLEASISPKGEELHLLEAPC